MADFNDVVKIEWYSREGQCVTLENSKGKTAKICYPFINEAIIDGKIELIELHREYGQELIMYPKSKKCSITGTTLECK